MPAQIHVGDIGTAFRLTIHDEDEDIVDVSAASSLTITFRKPDGTELEKNATFTTDGTDGKIEYVSLSGDLDQPGIWRIQGFVHITAGEYRTDINQFRVYGNL